MADESLPKESATATLLRQSSLLCVGVIALSVASCVVIAFLRSTALTRVTVTALDQDAEPRDHGIPLLHQVDALPDYKITVRTTDRWLGVSLGAKPNQSAAQGLTWQLPEPVSINDISSVRLEDQDKVLSDALAEVQLSDKTVSSGNYRFDFDTERSFAVGIQSFFGTPIGKAIASAFVIATLIVIIAIVSPFFG